MLLTFKERFTDKGCGLTRTGGKNRHQVWMFTLSMISEESCFGKGYPLILTFRRKIKSENKFSVMILFPLEEWGK